MPGMAATRLPTSGRIWKVFRFRSFQGFIASPQKPPVGKVTWKV